MNAKEKRPRGPAQTERRAFSVKGATAAAAIRLLQTRVVGCLGFLAAYCSSPTLLVGAETTFTLPSLNRPLPARRASISWTARSNCAFVRDMAPFRIPETEPNNELNAQQCMQRVNSRKLSRPLAWHAQQGMRSGRMRAALRGFRQPPWHSSVPGSRGHLGCLRPGVRHGFPSPVRPPPARPAIGGSCVREYPGTACDQPQKLHSGMTGEKRALHALRCKMPSCKMPSYEQETGVRRACQP